MHTDEPHLLLADDDPLGRAITARRLAQQGYRVDVAEDGSEALSLCLARRYDLVLLDMHMPGMNGLAVLRRLREVHAPLALPVIMVTADSDEQRIVEALEAGANDYLVKPLNARVAQARIQAQLSMARYAGLKDDLLRFASHDLKKPALLLRDIAESIQERLAQAVPQERALRDEMDLLLQGVGRMEQVIQGFLDDALQAPGRADPVDLAELVRSVINANRRYTQRKRIALEAALPATPPVVALDGFRLRQVLENLVGNAIKFSPADTRVMIAVRADPQAVTLAVQDAGPGLRPEDFPHLFERGAVLSNRPIDAEASSGLGLALCKELVEQLGGTIGARNNATGGAEFWVRLPASETI